jgi:hypothetical protein
MQGMAVSPFGMMDVSVLSEGGMEGLSSSRCRTTFYSLHPPRVRLYSTKTLKPLGTLDYHRKGCQAVTFAQYQHEQPPAVGADGEDIEDEMSAAEKADRRRWLAAGSQDSRVSVWSLISFEKP